MRLRINIFKMRVGILFFFIFPLKVFSQDLSGVWVGYIYNDTTQQTIHYELAINDVNGKTSGFSHTTFVIDGVKNIGVKEVKVKAKKNKVYVEDLKFVYDDYTESAAKGVKMFSFLTLSKNDSGEILRGIWRTNATRKYNPLTGSIFLEKKKKVPPQQTIIVKKLVDLGLGNRLAFLPPELQTQNTIALNQRNPPSPSSRVSGNGNVQNTSNKKPVRNKNAGDANAGKNVNGRETAKTAKTNKEATKTTKNNIVKNEISPSGNQQEDVTTEQKNAQSQSRTKETPADLAINEKKEVVKKPEEKGSTKSKSANNSNSVTGKPNAIVKSSTGQSDNQSVDKHLEQNQSNSQAKYQIDATALDTGKNKSADLSTQQGKFNSGQVASGKETSSAQTATASETKTEKAQNKPEDLAVNQQKGQKIISPSASQNQTQRKGINANAVEKKVAPTDTKTKVPNKAQDVAANEQKRPKIISPSPNLNQDQQKGTGENSQEKKSGTTGIKTNAQNNAAKIKATPAAAEISKRKLETIRTVEIAQDSLLFTLYDNGAVDGDTVSVLVNGKVVMPRVGLLATAKSKTIYLTPEMGDSISVVMYAENLGSIPPNTGLLVIHDGARIYEIRFSGDLEKNSKIILVRKKKT